MTIDNLHFQGIYEQERSQLPSVKVQQSYLIIYFSFQKCSLLKCTLTVLEADKLIYFFTVSERHGLKLRYLQNHTNESIPYLKSFKKINILLLVQFIWTFNLLPPFLV